MTAHNPLADAERLRRVGDALLAGRMPNLADAIEHGRAIVVDHFEKGIPLPEAFGVAAPGRGQHDGRRLLALAERDAAWLELIGRFEGEENPVADALDALEAASFGYSTDAACATLLRHYGGVPNEKTLHRLMAGTANPISCPGSESDPATFRDEIEI